MSGDPLRLLDELEPPGWSTRVDVDADPVAASILERVFADSADIISFDAARRRRTARREHCRDRVPRPSRPRLLGPL